MKKKDITALRSKKTDELLKLLAEKKKEAQKSQVEIKAGTEKNLKKASNIRRDIAVISTLMTEINLMQEEEPEKKVEERKVDK
ncbi:MAG: hypothetical protein UX19_C0002G0014 [Candidatus Woesebacteria bacterium GW2011_GWA1_45_8]|uniref:Large ribosomal subunit protein uL29 n=1 Tax=Candidatus Woesebacteria bacterium GW2011_GWA1_45_8 TaxID=1618559 RepID=A0A0G1MVV6_9BACT|nr:MAG: hypothetical protein UX19_C0002G0014 [Candidatus Woesebacteria bacterium GW2011_GWA1_45_8]